MSSLDPINWEKRRASIDADSTLEKGSTYLSVYSEIYSLTEHRTHNLTATVSLRNVNVGDTIFIESAEYFNTHGESIRNYIQNSIFIAPLETVEIVIDEQDKTGGTGANFIFNWAIQPGSNPPLFEGVMISTSGQQGLSFTTQGHILK
ncbi:MAG: DUF3124 domain-containing protein [Luteibaculum sp.]